MRFEDSSNGAAQEEEERQARILIADDHGLVREGLTTMLSSEEGLEVIGEATDGIEALEMCRSLKPDLVLMDVRMPHMDGLEATSRIKQELPTTSVVMVTMHENPDYLLKAVRAGAAGYVLKDSSGEDLLGAVRRTLEGESPLNQDLAMELLVRLIREGEEATPRGEESQVASAGREALAEGRRNGDRVEQLENLTPREVEVLKLLSHGQTNPQIARNLLVSRGTVKIHVQHIISKLGVSDRTQAAVRAIELGLLGLEAGS